MAEQRLTLKYKLYRSKRNRHLHDAINIAGLIWNEVTALQNKSYQDENGYIPSGHMKRQIAALRRSHPDFTY